MTANAPSLTAGHSATAITRFVAITVLVLAADLGLKYAAFEYVADRPIDLVQTQDEVDAGLLEHGGERYVIVYDDPGKLLRTQPSHPVIPGLLDFHLTTNTGAVFGLGQGARWLFIGVSILAVLVIGRLFWRSPADAWVLHLAFALILAGAIGNLYDRVQYSAVRDMLHMLPGVELPFGLAWPSGVREVWPWIFNLADAALMIGVGLVLVLSLFTHRADPKSKDQPVTQVENG